MSLDLAVSQLFLPSGKRSAGTGTSYFDYFPFFTGGSAKTPAVSYKRSLQLSAVHNAVEQISNDIAKIPFGVYRNLNGSRERMKSHAADWLISVQPNAYMTSFVERKTMAVSVLMRGNALSKINTNAIGEPATLDFIDWDRVSDIKLYQGDLLYYVDGYDQPLLSSEVLHIKGFSHNGIVGVSVITYACMQLNLAIEVQQYSATSFEHKGQRQGVIESEKVLSNDKGDAKPKIIASFKAAMAEKSPDRVAVLDDGMKWKGITLTAQELQIIEQQRFSVEDIARWFNIAPHKIKSLQQSTNNNIEQQSLDHVSDTIQPHVTNFEQEYSRKLLTAKERENMYVKGNMNVLLRADLKTRAEFYSRGVLSGYMNRNEVRELEDMNKGPELLNEFLTPVNTFTEGQIAKALKEKSNE